MSRSKKDGRRRGAHGAFAHPGKEYWSARGGSKFAMADWGTLKPELHRHERRVLRAQCKAITGRSTSTKGE